MQRLALKVAYWALAAVLSVLIIASRKHYTVDIVVAWYTVPLVFLALERRWTTRRTDSEAYRALDEVVIPEDLSDREWPWSSHGDAEVAGEGVHICAHHSCCSSAWAPSGLPDVCCSTGYACLTACCCMQREVLARWAGQGHILGIYPQPRRRCEHQCR
jgi:PAP2 superfamily C-terminal